MTRSAVDSETGRTSLEVSPAQPSDLQILREHAATEARIVAEGTVDARDGMAWWNGLSDHYRRVWLGRSGGTTAAEAWACYKTYEPRWNEGVVGESGAEHVRNALTILHGIPWPYEMNVVREGLEAAEQRLEYALAALEQKPVDVIQDVEELVGKMELNDPREFAGVIVAMQRDIVALTEQLDALRAGTL